MVKAEAKSKSKPKTVAAVEALKKKYQEQRLAKEKKSLTKLAQKGKKVSLMHYTCDIRCLTFVSLDVIIHTFLDLQCLQS